VACDLETVTARTDTSWRELLGQERFKIAARIAREQSEPADLAATRLWSAAECLKKAGLSAQTPLVLDSATADGWVLLRSGALVIATAVTSVCGIASPLVVAVAVPGGAVAEQSVPVAAARG
jgi:enediyne polyketide synthase